MPVLASHRRPKTKKAPENQGLNRISLPALAGLCRLGNHSHSIINPPPKPLNLKYILYKVRVHTIKNTIYAELVM
jgi:hypothetical protein